MRKYQYYNTNDDNDRDGYTANWMAQTFTPEYSHIIGSVKLKLFRVGDPETITVSIKATTGGEPVGADLCSGTIEGMDLTDNSNGEWYEISLGDGFDLTAGVQYAIVVRAPSGDASNKVSWRADITSPTYTGGTYCATSDSGVDWDTYADVDCMFEEWGVGPASPQTVVWGNLYKSQISAEKIEEAITRLIQSHEDDPDAHVEVGESLYSHKASAIIDHIIASIIEDKIKIGAVDFTKLALDKMFLATCFESLDGWIGKDGDPGGFAQTSLFGCELRSDNDINDEYYLTSETYGTGEIIDFTKNPFFQTTVQAETNTSQLIYITVGLDKYFGFKISNGTLYAVHEDGGGEIATEITGITITDWNVYRAIYNDTDSKIYFYVNGVLEATHDTDLPAGTDAFIFYYYVQTLAAATRAIYIRDLLVMFDR